MTTSEARSSHPAESGEAGSPWSSSEIPQDDPHAVEAFYDSATGQAVGGIYGWPVLYCSCGFRAIAESWEDAGTLYDEHVEEVRSA